jgi:hypothetical protein
MSFTGNEEHEIDLETASEWTANYRAGITSGDTIAHYFGKNYIKDIFSQEGCVGMRIYYAIDGEGAKQLIITGVDGNGDDLYNGLLAEYAMRSPPFSGVANDLNS